MSSQSGGYAQPCGESTVSVATLLREQTDLSHLPYLRTWKSSMASSYDRTGGNDDAHHFLSVDENEVALLTEMQGPGAITRIWSANPNGRMRIYLDDNPEPVLDLDFGKLINGTTDPFFPPITQHSSGGYYSYFPIPYQKSCRITVDKPFLLFYQINYDTYAPETQVRTFSLPLAPEDEAALVKVVDFWNGLGVPYLTKEAAQTFEAEVATGTTVDIASFNGPLVIDRLQMQVAVPPPAFIVEPGVEVPISAEDKIRKLILRGYFDGHTIPDIEAPVVDFFGSGFGRLPFRSLLLSQNEAGLFQCDFPMPFGKSARFTVENGIGEPATISVKAVTRKTSFSTDTQGYFHARWQQQVTENGVPHVWLRAEDQRGHFVGVVQSMKSPSKSLNYLEGDDLICVDEEAFVGSDAKSMFQRLDSQFTAIAPWNGTGTEDYFNSGWYFKTGPVALPTHGASIVDGETGRCNAYRWMIPDAPIFQNTITAQIEHGFINDFPNCYYSSVAYWYSTGEATLATPMPPASEIEPPHGVPLRKIEGAIEGVDLIKEAKASAGQIGENNMEIFGNICSSGNQLTWTGGKEGDTLTLTLPPHPGEHEVILYFTKCPNYGIVSIALNGTLANVAVDTYTLGFDSTGPVSLGKVTLPDGPSQLVLTLQGRNPEAKDTSLGFDCIVFKQE